MRYKPNSSQGPGSGEATFLRWGSLLKAFIPTEPVDISQS